MFGPLPIRILAGITFIARPIKPRIKSAEAKVESVDIISGLFVASSITVSLSGE